MSHQQIKLTDNFSGGEYANFLQVGHNKEEFRLLFANIFEPTGRVVAKITMTPAHYKRAVVALKENIDRYEAQFGVIADVATVVENTPIGFGEGESRS